MGDSGSIGAPVITHKGKCKTCWHMRWHVTEYISEVHPVFTTLT
jgi:hypothetical protein